MEMPDEKMRKMPFPGAVALANMFQFWKEVCALFRKLRIDAGSSLISLTWSAGGHI